jgi:hypothetical protein
MLSRMVPSSPPAKRTLHLLKTPDILCANDMRRLTVNGFDNWLLFYRDTEDRIDVIRVLHGARDIAAIFEEDA